MDRLSAQDLMMLWPEELGWSQDIGGLAILDGGSLLDADGRFLIETAREAIRRRLHLVPRFRQLLYQPGFGLGWPLWTDAPAVDIAEHVRVFPLDAPADESRLLLACEQLRHRRLDRSRPLWEMWFLPGLAHGRVGLFIKVHHAIADGVAGIAMLGAFVDLVPDPPRPASHRGRRHPDPRRVRSSATTCAGTAGRSLARSAGLPIPPRRPVRPAVDGRRCARPSSRHERRGPA
jgi:diacylglycerol O-acyltransferase / wax synthase